MKTIFLVLGLALLAATVARAQIGGSLEKFGRLIGGEETAPARGNVHFFHGEDGAEISAWVNKDKIIYKIECEYDLMASNLTDETINELFLENGLGYTLKEVGTERGYLFFTAFDENKHAVARGTQCDSGHHTSFIFEKLSK